MPLITHCYLGTLVIELVIGNKSNWKCPPLVIGYQLLFQIFFQKVSEGEMKLSCLKGFCARSQI